MFLSHTDVSLSLSPFPSLSLSLSLSLSVNISLGEEFLKYFLTRSRFDPKSPDCFKVVRADGLSCALLISRIIWRGLSASALCPGRLGTSPGSYLHLTLKARPSPGLWPW